MKEQFREWRPNAESIQLVEQANEFLEAFSAKGFTLTLRQLYYQFISNDIFANTEKNYSRLGDTISKARDAGLVDWDEIVDRTRTPNVRVDWKSPGYFVQTMAEAYSRDLWIGQKRRVEVWVEKDALSEIIERAAEPYGVTTFANRGYVSASAMYESARRIASLPDEVESVIILHFGDHDPSGVDMTRDIEERLSLYVSQMVRPEFVFVERIALSIDQVRRYKLPPNPAKLSDARAKDYVRRYGRSSWELDALPPDVLSEMVEDAIAIHCDGLSIASAKAVEKLQREKIVEAGKALNEREENEEV